MTKNYNFLKTVNFTLSRNFLKNIKYMHEKIYNKKQGF